MTSIGVAGIFVLAKLWAFPVTGSLAIAASAADSALDLLVSATAISVAGIAIGFAAIDRLTGAAQPSLDGDGLGRVIMGLSVLLTLAIVRF